MATTRPSKQILFPLPPRYFRLYTEENLQLHQERKRLEADGHSLEHAVQDLFQLNLDPPPPLEGPYQMFGHMLTTEHKNPTLMDAGIKQLYPDDDFDHPEIMKQLTLHILQGILNLTQSLQNEKSSPSASVQQLNTTFLNLMYLINQYRPHQAIETITFALEKQVYDLKSCVMSLNKKMEHAQTTLQRLSKQPLLSTIPEIPLALTSADVVLISTREQIWQQMLALK